MRWDAARFERFCTRHQIERKHLLLVTIFGHGHPDKSVTQLLLEFAQGKGPAAVAAGRARATPATLHLTSAATTQPRPRAIAA